MTSNTLLQWAEHPETLNRETLYELRTLLARYPYFQTVRLLYLHNLYVLHDPDFSTELRQSVLYIADRRVLFSLIEGGKYRLQPLASLQPHTAAESEQPGVDRTMSLIDAFLSTMPQEPETLTPDYTTDYAAYYLGEKEEKPMYGQELIDNFINKEDAEIIRPNELNDAAEKAEQLTPPDIDAELDDSCFTETLARIYIKQHRYEKALEIIRKLSLNYPKKNAYFADQIRFLEKLIINAKSK
jgi:hypothetical protein